MIVKKRNGSEEDFDFDKIVKAISAAAKSSGYTEKIDLGELDRKFTDLSLEYDEDYVISVDEIHKIVEEFLFSKGLEKPYRAYVIERNRKDTILAQDSYLIKGISEKLMAKDVQNQNANVDEYSFGGRIGEASRYVTKDYALNYCMSKKARKNHENNEIYIHDLDSYAVGLHNCLSIPFDELLSRGFVVRQTDVRPANSINTACQLVAVIFQVQSLQQFGGVSATHLDWTLVPYLRKSFFKHFSDHYVESCFDQFKDGDDLVEFKKSKRKEFKEKYNIQDEKYTIGDFSMDCVDFHIDDPKIKDINPTWYNCAYYETLSELKQAIEGMYHNLNTLQSRSGNQLEVNVAA